MKFTTLLLILALTHPALAKEGFFVFEKTYVGLYDSKTDLKDKSLRAVILKEATKFKDQTFTVNKDLRPKILKDLKIEESDSVFVRAFNESKTHIFKVSDLKLMIEMNPAGDTDVGNIGLDIPLDKEGIVAIGKTNPFNDKAKFAESTPVQGTYTITPNLKLIEKATQTPEQATSSKETNFKVGIYEFSVQVGKEAPTLVKTFEIDIDSYVSSSVRVYGGDILADGSPVIFITKFSGCGFIIFVKNKKPEVYEPTCGSMGC